jgi:hypothetical protein
MRKLALLLLFAAMASPALAAKRITVAQLEQTLTVIHGKPDAEIARHLYALELTERLSAAKLAQWQKELSGFDTRQALIALADQSAFFDPPPAENPTTAAPDIDSQRQLLQLADQRVAETLSKLPNFFAERKINLFEDTPAHTGPVGVSSIYIPYRPLHEVAKFDSTVLYRDHNEVVDWGETKIDESDGEVLSLLTMGEFGPILRMVLADGGQGTLTWSHWEQGAAGQEAVYRYSVPKGKSHYQTQFCCIPAGSNHVYKEFSGYHGEITLDAINGTIHRLTLQADLKAPNPMTKTNLMVEYGPVEIGGKTYICPVRSVALALAQQQARSQSSGLADYGGFMGLHGSGEDSISTPETSLQTLLIDVTFAKYHMFRSESRILVDNTPEPKEK